MQFSESSSIRFNHFSISMLLLICGNSIDIKGLIEKSNNIIKIISIMSFNNLEKIITRTGIVSLAILGVIGIVAALFCTVGIDLDLFAGTVAEDIFCFSLIVLSILVGFCFPASFLMNFSSIAVSIRNKRLQ